MRECDSDARSEEEDVRLVDSTSFGMPKFWIGVPFDVSVFSTWGAEEIVAWILSISRERLHPNHR